MLLEIWMRCFTAFHHTLGENKRTEIERDVSSTFVKRTCKFFNQLLRCIDVRVMHSHKFHLKATDDREETSRTAVSWKSAAFTAEAAR